MTSKRHAPPSVLALVNRVYRKVIALEKIATDAAMIHVDNKIEIEAIGMRMASIVSSQKRINETLRTLTDHCTRLLREKETLQKQIAKSTVHKDDERMWTAPLPKPKQWIHTFACDANNTGRLWRGELPKCICGAIK
jgi:hypothetical protein